MLKKLICLLCALALLAAFGAMAEEEEILLTVDERMETAVSDAGVSNDDAVKGFINQAFGIGTSRNVLKAPRATQGSKLTGPEAKLYAYLKAEIAKIAKGERSSTEFLIPYTDLFDKVEYTAEELGVSAIIVNNAITAEAQAAFVKKMAVDAGAVVSALLVDCPFDLYWFDKTMGYTYGGLRMTAKKANGVTTIYVQEGYNFRILMSVSNEYAPENPQTCPVEFSDGVTRDFIIEYDTSFADSILAASNNAKGIVGRNRSKTDYEKLKAYKEAICSLVSYNDAAAGGGHDYGNPWQLIWVFDNDDTTNVVCEGYSKAFKYLCDQSNFNTNISVLVVTGTMDGGAHMWNVVTMADGYRYLVDVTNCDSGTIGAPDQLFMRGYASHPDTHTYWYIADEAHGGVCYVYSSDLDNVYSEEDLILAGEDFDPENYEEAGNMCGNDLTWSVSNGVLTISGTGDMWDFDYDNGIIAPWSELSFTSVVLESGVTGIGTDAFVTCSALTDVYYTDTEEQWETITIGSGNDPLTGAEIHYNYQPVSYVAEGTCGDDLTWTLDGEGTLTISGTGAMYNYEWAFTCPASWGTYADSIENVVLESGVTSIGNYAFAWCQSLNTVTIPDTLTRIGSNAFSDATLSAINVDSGNAVYASQDGVLFNHGMTALIMYPSIRSGAYVIPDGVTSIGNESFLKSLVTDVTIPDGVTGIGDYAFSQCINLESVTIPASVTSIGNGAFYDCTSLTDVCYAGSAADRANITIGDSNEALTDAEWRYLTAAKLDTPVFSDIHCGTTVGTEFTATVTGPSDAVVIYTELYYWDETEGEYVDTLYWAEEDDIRILGFYFYQPGTYQLRSQALSHNSGEDPADDDSEVAVYTFTLTEAEIPDISDKVTLSRTEGLQWNDTITYTIEGAEAVTYHLNSTDGGGIGVPNSYVTGDSDSIRLFEPGNVTLTFWARYNGIWSQEKAITVYVQPLGWLNPELKWGGKGVGDELTLHVTSDLSFTLTVENAETVDYSAGLSEDRDSWDIYGYADGETMTIDLNGYDLPAGDYTIEAGGYREGWITNSRNVTLHLVDTPFTVDSGTITGYLLNDTASLTIPATINGQTITGIADFAFSEHAELTSVTFPEGLTSIGGFAFNDCSSLASITLPSSLTTLDDGAFLNCPLTAVNVASGATKAWYFYEPDSSNSSPRIYRVALPAAVTVASAPFLGSSLQNLSPDFTTPGNLRTIESEAFAGTAASFVWIRDGVTSVGSQAFDGCSRLQFVRIPDSCTSIGENAFPKSAILFVEWGSAGADYAQANGYTYIYYTEGFNG